MRKWTAPIGLLTLCLALGCSKKEESDSETSSTVTENMEKPAGVLDLAINAMGSAMDTDIAGAMVGSTALVGDEGFTIDDCDEHAEAVARATDDAEFKDSSDRLRISHPRAPLQTLYCQMQKDTGAPDSFLGALSQNKMLFCMMGEGLVFDGVEKTVTKTKEEFEACLGDASEEDKEEILADMEDEFDIYITAASPATSGAEGEWDGSIEIVFPINDVEMKLGVLLKDSDNILAVAANNGADRDINVDSYVASINKSTGEVWYEAMFQRIRTADGTSSNGWNRHMRAYVKGELDPDTLEFGAVSVVEGIYSDVSNNGMGDGGGAESEDEPLTSGTAWTVVGTEEDGFKSFSYQLNCAWDEATQTSDCPDASLVSSWEATEGSGACNGALTGTTCSGDGLEASEDEHTSFMMIPESDGFVNSEDWYGSLSVPDYTSLELTITQ
jgi:hypothetical protein